MKIFIDTAKLMEIKEALKWGIINGVTTNPSLIKAALEDEKKTGKKINMEEYIKEICYLVGKNASVSLEVISLQAEKMIEEAQTLFKKFNPVANNIAIKIPIDTFIKGNKIGHYNGLKAISVLTGMNIPINATLIMTPEQALLAAKAGARYVSPFMARIDNYVREKLNISFEPMDYYDSKLEREITSLKLTQYLGDNSHQSIANLYKDKNVKEFVYTNSDNGVYDGIDLVKQIVEILNKYNFKTEVLAASVRNKRQFREVAKAGVGVITVPFFLFKEMLQHPRTEIGLKTFCENVVDEYKELLN
ncbi:MAG: transaldolase [Candidatus Cloacimonetes bacterium]|nr:transaldolase [Candidatus Cloacimonadota bacterium]